MGFSKFVTMYVVRWCNNCSQEMRKKNRENQWAKHSHTWLTSSLKVKEQIKPNGLIFEKKAKQPIINHTHTHQTDGIRITKNEKLILMRNSMDKYEIGLSLIIRRKKETGVEDIFGWNRWGLSCSYSLEFKFSILIMFDEETMQYRLQ